MQTGLAVQSLLVTTTMPAIARDLGGLSLYGWVFSGWGLAALASIPLAGRASDRYGLAPPIAFSLAVFSIGTVIAGGAQSMPMLVAGRVLQGYGSGAQFALSFGTVAKAYPDAARGRVLALLSGAWVVPGLLGPSYGGLLASTVGWRWAFFSVLPVIGVAGALALPALASAAARNASPTALPTWWPILLALSGALVVWSLSTGTWQLAAPLAAAGLLGAGLALSRLLPPGTLVARRGLPVTFVGAFLLSFGIYAADGFVPLLLTGVRGRSLPEASLVVTLGTLAWSAGSWWQSRLPPTAPRRDVVRNGALVLAAGISGTAITLFSWVPLFIAYLSWFVAGVGMGVTYPAIRLIAINAATKGSEGAAMAEMQLTSTLGLSVGSGLGGVSIAISRAVHAPLARGLEGAFILAIAAALGTAALAWRLPDRPSTTP